MYSKFSKPINDVSPSALLHFLCLMFVLRISESTNCGIYHSEDQDGAFQTMERIGKIRKKQSLEVPSGKLT